MKKHTYVLLILPLLAGCGAPVSNVDTDYIRTGTPIPPPLSERGLRLFPAKIGVQLRDVRYGRTPVRETATARLENNGTSVIMEDRLREKRARYEAYLRTDKALFFRAAGNDKLLTLQPPIPLFHFPVTEGSVTNWTGKVVVGGSSAPATAISRVSGRNRMKYRGQTIYAYRVDTLLVATADGQRINIPAIRWFVPDYGIVQQKFLSGTTEVTKVRDGFRLIEDAAL